MVCIPCIVIPLLLFIWHKFLQPIFLKIFNPWGAVKAVEVESDDDDDDDEGDTAKLTKEDKDVATKLKKQKGEDISKTSGPTTHTKVD